MNKKGQFVEYVTIVILAILVLALGIFYIRTQGESYVKAQCINYMEDKSVKITIPAICPKDLIILNTAENVQYFSICNPTELTKTVKNSTNVTVPVSNSSEVYVLLAPDSKIDQQFVVYYQNMTKKYIIGSKSGVVNNLKPPVPTPPKAVKKKWYEFWK